MNARTSRRLKTIDCLLSAAIASCLGVALFYVIRYGKESLAAILFFLVVFAICITGKLIIRHALKK